MGPGGVNPETLEGGSAAGLFAGEAGLAGVAAFEVGDADGEGVGGVVGRGFGEAEEGADHEGDLGFVGVAAADDGLFDAAGGVFVDFESGFGGGDEGGSAGGAQGDGGLEVLHVDGGLDAADVGLVGGDDGAELAGDFGEAGAGEEFGGVADDAPGEGDVFAPLALHDGPAGVAEGGVDGEDAGGAAGIGGREHARGAGGGGWRGILLPEDGRGRLGEPGFFGGGKSGHGEDTRYHRKAGHQGQSAGRRAQEGRR